MLMKIIWEGRVENSKTNGGCQSSWGYCPIAILILRMVYCIPIKKVREFQLKLFTNFI